MLAALDLSDFLVIGLMIVGLSGMVTAALRPGDEARLRRLERKLDLVLRHLGIDVPDPTTAAGLSEEVRRLADTGQKIPAIKLHREQTGVGLREAKDAVEKYLDRTV